MAQAYSFTNTLLTEIAKWAVPLAGALVAVFFTPLVEHVKLRISRGALRIKQYEEFAMDVSAFLFQAELQHEFLASEWATAEDHNEITESYNEAITTFRTKELVYLAWAARYWRRSEMAAFREVLSCVRTVDAAVHAFNDDDDAAAPSRLLALKAANASLKGAALALLAPAANRPDLKAGGRD